MRRLALLPLMLLLPACSKPDPVAVDSGHTAPIMQPLYATLYSNVREPRRLVIRDAETWAAVWAEMISVGDPRTPPHVDFTKEDVLVAAMGERRAAGYDISINEVVEGANGVLAVVTSTTPAPACETSEIMTAPLAAIRVTKVTGGVAFEERGATVSCG
jgi:hypothetical protein